MKIYTRELSANLYQLALFIEAKSNEFRAYSELTGDVVLIAIANRADKDVTILRDTAAALYNLKAEIDTDKL